MSTSNDKIPRPNIKGVEAMLPDLLAYVFGDKRAPGVPAGITGRYLKYASVGMWALSAIIVALGPIAGFLGFDVSHIEPEHLYAVVFGSLVHTGAAVVHAHSRASNAAQALQAVQVADTPDEYKVVHKHSGIQPPKVKVKLTNYGHFSSNLSRTKEPGKKSKFTLPQGAKYVFFQYPDVKDYATAELWKVTSPTSAALVRVKENVSSGDGKASRFVFDMRSFDHHTNKYVPFEAGTYRIVADDDVDGDDNTESKDTVEFELVQG